MKSFSWSLQGTQFNVQRSLQASFKMLVRPHNEQQTRLPVATNVLNWQFMACVSDITYIRKDAWWLYLAIVLDLYARKVIGWARVPGMPVELVFDALKMAIGQ